MAVFIQSEKCKVVVGGPLESTRFDSQVASICFSRPPVLFGGVIYLAGCSDRKFLVARQLLSHGDVLIGLIS